MIDLFTHNQKAYDSAVDALKTSDRTCIIHPTGTGKSLIIAKFINENPDKKHLVFAPSLHIFEEIGKYTAVQFIKSTYSILTFRDALEDLKLTDLDFIYLDEFHRCGAKEWSENIEKVINANGMAKKVGATATHIRFLDRSRNMAEEFFANNISSQMSLGEAIERGILPQPIYIKSIFFKKGIVSAVEEKLKNFNRLPDKITPLLIDWENSSGIEQMVNKYLPVDRNKIIVFAPNLKSIEEIRNAIQPHIEKKIGKVESYEVSSRVSIAENQKRLQLFQTNNLPCILYAVDKINEGLHVKSADVIFLFRRTKSPILFFQQIGRAFSVGGRTPIIFDIANSILFKRKRDKGFVTNSFEFRGRRKDEMIKVANELIPATIIDEILPFIDLVQNFALTNFEQHYERLVAFKQLNGNLGTSNMPTSLRNIVYSFRNRYKSGELAENHIIKLKELGLTLENDIKWKNFYDALVQQVEESGKIDLSLLNEENRNYAYLQRSLYKSKNYSKERIEKLNNLGFVWQAKKSFTFEETLQKIIDFKNEHNRLPGEGDDMRLSSWIHYQRNRYKKNLLSPEVAALILEHIGIYSNSDILSLEWDENYNKAKMIFIEKGVVKIPISGHYLSKWSNYNKNTYTKGRLSREKINLLLAINFEFIVKREKNNPQSCKTRGKK